MRARDEASPLHVVHVVCSDGYAGVERYISRIAPALVTAGLRVTVIGGAPAQMAVALEGSGVHHVPASTIAHARHALATIPPARIVNSHMSEADLVGSLHIATHPAARLVSTRHFGARRGSGPAARAVFTVAGWAVARQISISRFVAEAIEGRSEVVHTGVDDAQAPPTDARDRVVLVAQRLEAEKDTATAVRAWAVSGLAAAGWRLDVAGTGSEFAALEALSAELGLAASVSFLGHRADISERMARAAIMIAPTPREGLGLSVLEAMAHATPVVASASGGHLESVGAVEGAALFAPRDARAAGRLLAELAADQERRVAYGERLQRQQRTEFSASAQLEGTLAVYRSALR